MRSFSLVTVTVLALTSSACGSPVEESGNAYVTEGALESVGVIADGASAPSVVPVRIDVGDLGCTVDGLRYNHCTLTPTTNVDYDGPLNLCELHVSSGETFVSECDLEVSSEEHVGRFEELPAHCPSSGASL